jgi:hypothetical protein
MPASFVAPQAGQTRARAVPQPPQNRDSARFSVPQFEQRIIAPRPYFRIGFATMLGVSALGVLAPGV